MAYPRRYIVRRTDGKPVSNTAQFFILRIDADPAARAVMRVYADKAEGTDPELAEQLRAWLRGFAAGTQEAQDK